MVTCIEITILFCVVVTLMFFVARLAELSTNLNTSGGWVSATYLIHLLFTRDINLNDKLAGTWCGMLCRGDGAVVAVVQSWDKHAIK